MADTIAFKRAQLYKQFLLESEQEIVDFVKKSYRPVNPQQAKKETTFIIIVLYFLALSLNVFFIVQYSEDGWNLSRLAPIYVTNALCLWIPSWNFANACTSKRDPTEYPLYYYLILAFRAGEHDLYCSNRFLNPPKKRSYIFQFFSFIGRFPVYIIYYTSNVLESLFSIILEFIPFIGPIIICYMGSHPILSNIQILRNTQIDELQEGKQGLQFSTWHYRFLWMKEGYSVSALIARAHYKSYKNMPSSVGGFVDSRWELWESEYNKKQIELAIIPS